MRGYLFVLLSQVLLGCDHNEAVRGASHQIHREPHPQSQGTFSGYGFGEAVQNPCVSFVCLRRLLYLGLDVVCREGDHSCEERGKKGRRERQCLLMLLEVVYSVQILLDNVMGGKLPNIDEYYSDNSDIQSFPQCLDAFLFEYLPEGVECVFVDIVP